MKEFEIKATMTVRLSTLIEAENQEQAEEMAEEIDGGDFAEVEGGCSWRIDEVNDLTPPKAPPMSKTEHAICGQLLSEYPEDWTLAQVLEELRANEWASDKVTVWEGVDTLGGNAVAQLIEDLCASVA